MQRPSRTGHTWADTLRMCSCMLLGILVSLSPVIAIYVQDVLLPVDGVDDSATATGAFALRANGGISGMVVQANEAATEEFVQDAATAAAAAPVVLASVASVSSTVTASVQETAAIDDRSAALEWNNRGLRAVEAYDLEGAAEAFAHAVRLQPDEAVFWFNWAQILHVQKKHDRAVTAYERGAQLEPSPAALHLILWARSLESSGRTYAAWQRFTQAELAQPGCCTVDLGRTLARAGAEQLLDLARRQPADLRAAEWALLQGMLLPARMSVVVPCYRCADTIRGTLASIDASLVRALQLNTHLPGLRSAEVVVVNDGSDDDSAVVLQQLQRDRSAELAAAAPLRVLHLANNTGRSWAREEGVRFARGDVLLFCDADDLYDEAHVDVCVGALQLRPTVDFASTRVRIDAPMHPEWRAEFSDVLLLPKCVRRRCHERIGGFPRDDVFRVPGYEDIYYSTLLLNRCTDTWVPAETVQYVRRPGNTLDRNLARYQRPPSRADVDPGDDPDWAVARQRMADALRPEARRGS